MLVDPQMQIFTCSLTPHSYNVRPPRPLLRGGGGDVGGGDQRQ